MTEDMVKKSVDIPKDDDEWLDEQPINFSKFVRRKLAERRAEDISRGTKQRLYTELDRMAEKGQELIDRWRDRREEIKDEFEVEMIDRQPEYFRFEIDGEEYSSDWAAERVSDYDGEEIKEGKTYKFAKKYTSEWLDTVDEFTDFVESETDFEKQPFEVDMMTFEGRGFLSDFTVYASYLPTELEEFSIKFNAKVHIDVVDLERDVDIQVKSE